ncbi:MAG: hypothetical protein KGI25_02995 [Thaumarchaeota archaeon]|nr:hypothetical protein [Nitrososphaerota archaeon]
MKLTEFKVRAPRGTYYGARPTKQTCESLLDFISDNQIPNPLEEKLLHCTVIYSRVFCGERALGDLDPHWKGEFDAYNVWPTSPKQDQEPTHCLTLGFICPEMHQRHRDLRAAGATHDFPDFNPHITLSYDVGNEFEYLLLPHYSGPLHFHHEYSEPLNLEFVKTKVNT